MNMKQLLVKEDHIKTDNGYFKDTQVLCHGPQSRFSENWRFLAMLTTLASKILLAKMFYLQWDLTQNLWCFSQTPRHRVIQMLLLGLRLWKLLCIHSLLILVETSKSIN